MRKWLLMLLVVGLVISTTACRAPSPKGSESIVRAVLFWSETCPHCHEVMTHHLPPLEEKYGDRLEIKTIEVSEQANYQLWNAAMEAFQVPPGQRGVPMLFIGDTVLVGSVEIPERLPGLIEQYLAAGGVDYPAIPGLPTD